MDNNKIFHLGALIKGNNKDPVNELSKLLE